MPHERVPLRELDGRARVRRVLLRAGELREDKCLPGTSTLTALETVSGPGYCLITSMPMDWSVVCCAEEVFLAGGIGAVVVAFRATGGAHLIRAHRRCERLESTPGAGVDMWRVPRYKVR